MHIEKRMKEKGIKQNQGHLDQKYQLTSFTISWTFFKDIVINSVTTTNLAMPESDTNVNT